MSDKKEINITIGENTDTEVIAASVLTLNMPERAGTTSIINEPVLPRIFMQFGHKKTSAHESLEHFAHRIIPSFKPCIVWYGANTYIKPLHEWSLPKSTVAQANTHGMHIYLYEPLCMYYQDDPKAPFTVFNSGFYSEFNADMVDDHEKIRAAELDSISHFVYSNGLENVTVHTGDYNVEKLSYYTTHMNLICDDLFLSTLTFYDHVDTTPKPALEKHFFSSNWRFTVNRCIISSILANKQSDLIYYFKQPESMFDDGVWFSWEKYGNLSDQLQQEVRAGLETLNAKSPWYIDMPADSPVEISEAVAHWYPDPDKMPIGHGNPASFNQLYLPLQPYYRRCFVDIINESRFAQPTGNISEKVLQAVHMKTPFIMVGPPHNLDYLHDLGYKTFDAWWDESYDAEHDPLKRLKKIHELINWISEQSLEDLHSMYMDMMPVLDHNFTVLTESLLNGQLADHTLIRQDGYVYVEKQWMPEDNTFIGVRYGGDE